MKTNTEIAIECGAIVHADGNIFLTNETKLQAIIDAVNARDSEPVAEVQFNIDLGWYCLLSIQDVTNHKIEVGDKLFTSPQPNQSAYIKRLEDALKTIREDLEYANNHGWIADTIWHTETETLFDYIDEVISLATKESIDG